MSLLLSMFLMHAPVRLPQPAVMPVRTARHQAVTNTFTNWKEILPAALDAIYSAA